MDKIKIKVLILPKFETGIIAGNDTGEAYFLREKYLNDPVTFEIKGVRNSLCVQNGIAMMVCGMGKVNTAASVTALFCDSRFDLTDALILGIGCGAGAYGRCVMGDVCLVSAVCDLDLGHRVDIRDAEDKNAPYTWFHDNNYDDHSYYILNRDFIDEAYKLVKNIQLDTTKKTKTIMAYSFDGEKWAQRNPEVLVGTAVTSDNYWKGKYDHDNAEYACSIYKAEDPFVVSEMEDSALTNVCFRFGMLHHLLIVRNIVNMDVYLKGTTPKTLWDPLDGKGDELIPAEEAADIFETAQLNSAKTIDAIIDAWLSGKISFSGAE